MRRIIYLGRVKRQWDFYCWTMLVTISLFLITKTIELAKQGKARDQHLHLSKTMVQTNMVTEDMFNSSQTLLEQEQTLFRPGEPNETQAGSEASLNRKTIVWYDFYDNGHEKQNLDVPVSFSSCAVKNCEVKFEIVADDDGPVEGDAVLVKADLLQGLRPPVRRDANQVFVLVENNACKDVSRHMGINKMGSQWAKWPKWSAFFNWTMTYHQNADILYKYTEILRRDSDNPGSKKNCNKIFAGKLNSSAWMVTDCDRKLEHDHFVTELQKFTPVKVYGACGDTGACSGHNSSKCLRKLAEQSKFNLVFENKNSMDCVTEQFNDWFQQDIITVVLGGSKYANIGPSGTFVHAEDFRSPEELGTFLNELGNDRARYIEYMKRKDAYYIRGPEDNLRKAYCQLCEWLHSLESHRKSYKHIGQWWRQVKLF